MNKKWVIFWVLAAVLFLYSAYDDSQRYNNHTYIITFFIKVPAQSSWGLLQIVIDWLLFLLCVYKIRKNWVDKK